MTKRKDETGNRYGRLTALEPVMGRGRVHWICQCTCGGTTIVYGSSLRRGLTKSCGCLAKEIAAKVAPINARKTSWKREKKNKITRSGGTAFIHLPNGMLAMISVKDVLLVKELCWGGLCGGGGNYVRSSSGIYLHRLILGVVRDRTRQVDHRDGNPLNNRRSNLRIKSRSANIQKSRRAPGKSGYRGVWSPRKGVFAARLTVDRKMIHLGEFSSLEEAAAAYNRAARKYYGKDAMTNGV